MTLERTIMVAEYKAPETHAFASPSKLEDLEKCPFMARCCDGWESPASEAAERGRRIHEAVYDDAALDLLEGEDRDMALQIRAEYVMPLVDDGWELHHELRLEISFAGRVITFGTADLVAIKGSRAVLKDWKTGRTPVTVARRNMQMWAYSVGICQMFPQVEEVEAEIVQPPLPKLEEPKATFPKIDIMDTMLGRVVRIVNRAEGAVPQDAVPDPDTCKWCNKLNCPKWREKMAQIATADIGLDPVGILESLPAMEKVELVAYCDDLLGRCALLQEAVESRMELAKKIVKANGGSENYRLGKPSERKVVDYKALLANHGIGQEEIDQFTTIKICEPSLVRKVRKAK